MSATASFARRRALLALLCAAAPALAAETAPAVPPPVRAALGVVTRDPMEFEREMWRLEGGAWIVKLNPEGAAAQAGVGRDDVIVGIDEVTIADSAGLVAALSARRPGEKVRLRIIRRGHPVEVDAMLGAGRP